MGDTSKIQGDSIHPRLTSQGGPKKRGRPVKNGKPLESSFTSEPTSTLPAFPTDGVHLAVKSAAKISDASWGRARTLQRLEMDDALVGHIEWNKSNDPLRFFEDQTALLLARSQVLGQVPPFQALVECLISAKAQRRSNVIGHVRYLFKVLLIGDIAVTMFGRKGNIKDEHISQLKDFVIEKVEQMDDIERNSVGLADNEKPIEELLTNLKTISKRGARLVWFCSQFGTGSLFWLHGLFTDNL